MPLTFRFTLNKTAGRKCGDETGPTMDHRVTSKPWQKRKHSIAEKPFGQRCRQVSEGQGQLASGLWGIPKWELYARSRFKRGSFPPECDCCELPRMCKSQIW